jgi:hypothetical protein
VADILSVEVGDQFISDLTKTALKVVKIWFEFSVADERWETSVTWVTESKSGDSFRVSGKGREFVQNLKSGSFGRLSKAAESPSNDKTTTPTLPVFPPSTDIRKQQWEEDFRRNAAKYGLSPSDLGRKVTLNPRKPRHFTIIGAKPRNYKMPILVQGKRGGVYKITAAKAKAGLA